MQIWYLKGILLPREPSHHLGCFWKGVESIQAHKIPMFLSIHQCVWVYLYQFVCKGYNKNVLENEGGGEAKYWKLRKTNSKIPLLHFLVCSLMFPADALHWNREKRSDLEIKLQSQWQSNIYVQKNSHYFKSNSACVSNSNFWPWLSAHKDFICLKCSDALRCQLHIGNRG